MTGLLPEVLPPRDDAYEFDAVAVVQRMPRPFGAEQCLAVEFDQEPLRVEGTARGEFAQRQRGGNLARAAVDEDTEASVRFFRHGFKKAGHLELVEGSDSFALLARDELLSCDSRGERSPASKFRCEYDPSTSSG